jgi:hypothetical protein
MKIKPADASQNPKALLRQRLRHSAAVCPPFKAWILAADLSGRAGDAFPTGAVGSPMQPATADTALEQLSSRVVRAVRAAPVSLDPHRLMVTFHSGRLQGVSCEIVVAGRRVGLRLRADGARQRSDLFRGRKILAGRLGSAGFELGGYEVSP